MSLNIPTGYCSIGHQFGSDEGTPPFVVTYGMLMAGEAPDPLASAQIAHNLWVEHMLPEMDSDLYLLKTTATVEVGGGYGSVDWVPATSAPGERVGEGFPWSQAVIIRKHTPLLGRKGRGRMFVPGLVKVGEVGQSGSISTTRRLNLSIVVTEWLDSMVYPEGDEAAWPFLLHDETSGQAPTLITAFSVAPVVGWVRKRIR